MKNGPKCSGVQRFLPAQILSKKLAQLGARIEGTGEWRLVVPFRGLEELKDKRRRITTVLRRYEGLIEERPDLVEELKRVGSEWRERPTRVKP